MIEKKKRNQKNKNRNCKVYFSREFRKSYTKIIRVGSSVLVIWTQRILGNKEKQKTFMVMIYKKLKDIPKNM